MRTGCILLTCVVFGTVASCFSPCIAETLPPNSGPIQAELVGKIDAGRAKIGDAVYAKVKVKWQDNNLTLQEGATLKGHVVAQSARSKTSKSSQIALFFDSVEYTRNDTRPLRLTLAAVMAPDDADPDSSEYQPLSDAIGVVLQSNVSSGPSKGNPVRSVSASAESVYFSPKPDKRPKSIAVGEVVGIRGLKLSMGSGPEGSSVLYMSGRNVHLESGSLLAFLPSTSEALPTNERGAADSTNTIPAPKAAAPSQELADGDTVADEADACIPPDCNLALPLGKAELRSKTVSAIPVKEFGYGVPVDHEMYGFDYDSAVAYLGPAKLLFTFNPHLLFKRSNAEAGLAKLHMIRAVVMDLNTMKIEQTMDWRIHDANQYLWPAGPGRVLVHVGRELRMYGSQLKQEQTIVLDDRLAFVTTSPSKTYFAVGVVQERHSEKIHRELVRAEGREPEEDVEVRVLDAKLHVLATVLQSSRFVPPVLSDNGEIGAVAVGQGRWRIQEQTWDKQKHVLGQVSSLCRPQMTSMVPNLLFVVGCDRQGDGRWYRILRPNGKLLLKGWSSSEELEQTVTSSDGGETFAILVVKTTRSIGRGSLFETVDLDNQQISVYRVENGKRVFGFRLASPVPTKQSFGLSPDGDQLAVLSGDQISLYSLTAQ